MRLMAAHAGDAHVLGPAIPSVLTPPQPATWPGETHVMRAAPAACMRWPAGAASPARYVIAHTRQDLIFNWTDLDSQSPRRERQASSAIGIKMTGPRVRCE